MIMSDENKKGSTVQDFKDRLDVLDICVFCVLYSKVCT